MHPPLAAGIRRRARLALLAAALPAALAVPPGADAATVSLDLAGTVNFRAASGELNRVTIALEGTGVLVRDLAGRLTGSGQCARRSDTEVLCAGSPILIRRVDVRLENGNDSFSSRTALETLVDGGPGDDTFFAGMAPSTSRVEYRGNSGDDTVSYASATGGVSMRQDELRNDGRPARGDSDNVRRDVESFIGSPFADFLAGSPTGLVFCAQGCSGSTVFQRFTGGAGNDVVVGGANGDIHFMGGGADGADRIQPGPGFSIVDYSGRGTGVNVSVAQGTRDDGAPGEGDDILRGADQLLGGRGNDVLTAERSGRFFSLDGGPGNDTLTGSDGDDALTGGTGSDTLLALGGNDFVTADDGEADTVGCGSGTDTARLDSRDGFNSCENRPVGVLRLAPKTSRAEVGEPTHLRLSWRHPRSWRKLRTVALRLYAERVPVGEVAIGLRNGRISVDGAVTLMRKGTGLTRKGRTVTARLAVRLAESLAGKALTAEVEATDTRGSRQLERDAGTLRVAR